MKRRTQKMTQNEKNQNPNTENTAEQVPAGEDVQNTPPAAKQKYKVHVRCPIERVPVADEQPEDDGNTEKGGKRTLRERLATFGRGAVTGALILGAGLVAYGKAARKREEEREREQYTDVSSEDDDSEYARTLPVYPTEDEGCESEETGSNEEEPAEVTVE